MTEEELKAAVERELRACRVASLDDWPVELDNDRGCECCGDSLSLRCGGLTGTVGSYHVSRCEHTVTADTLGAIRRNLEAHLAVRKHVVLGSKKGRFFRAERYEEEKA